MTWRTCALIAIGLFTASAAGPLAQPAQTGWDAKFRELPQASNIRASMERMSARPHHVGSPYDKDNADWILARFKEWGWDAQIERFDVLFPTPKELLLEMQSNIDNRRDLRKLVQELYQNPESLQKALAELKAYGGFRLPTAPNNANPEGKE